MLQQENEVKDLAKKKRDLDFSKVGGEEIRFVLDFRTSKLEAREVDER